VITLGSSVLNFSFVGFVISNMKKNMNDIIREIVREQKGFETPSLNEHLYLHMKSFRKIEGLEEYVNLKTLWLQSNAIERIENLNANIDLRNLFLENNMIQRIENLSTLSKLVHLNLGGNRIRKIEGLDQLKCLSVLDLSGNLLSNLEDVAHLQKCTSLTNIDLSSNNLDDLKIKDMFVPKYLPSLRCLSLRGNPVVNKIKHYRKSMIVASPSLCKLDSRVILKSDREIAEAWSLGKSVREVRTSQKNELKRRHQTQMKRFREWKERRRKELLLATTTTAAVASEKKNVSSDTKKDDGKMMDSETKNVIGRTVLNQTHAGTPIEGTVTGFDYASKLFRVDYAGMFFVIVFVVCVHSLFLRMRMYAYLPLSHTHTRTHTFPLTDETWDFFALDFLKEMLVVEAESSGASSSSTIVPKLPEAEDPYEEKTDTVPGIPALGGMTIVDELD